MAQVRITDDQGVERATLALVEATIEWPGFHATPEAKLRVERDAFNAVSGVTPGADRVFLEDPAGVDSFGGVLLSPHRTGGTTTLRVDGFEEYLRRAQPVGLGNERVGVDDSVLIAECVDATPELTKGTINTIASGETWVFSGETQLGKARAVAIAAGGELAVNPDLSVDYTASRGSDKTSTTLSPANGSFVENTFNADEDARSGRTTHLKVYGVGQGSHQIEATIVPADDSGSYTNQATYVNDDWSDGDPEVWDSLTNKDLKNVSALQTWGQTLMADLPDPETRVSTVVKGATVELGDEFHVEHPEEGIDADLRAVKVVERIGADGGTRYDVVFSSHSVNLESAVEEDHRDTTRYNLSYEGDLVQLEKGPGRGPVDSTHDYELAVFYPDDVVAEVRAELHVRGFAYRAFAKGAASGGGSHSHSVSVTHPEHAHDLSFEAPKHVHVATEIVDRTTGSTDVGGGGHTHTYDDRNDGNNENLTSLTTDTETSTTALGTTSSETSDATTPNHTHDPDPGLLDWDGSDQSPAHYPENVKVVIGGTTLDLGTSGTFQSGADDGTQAFEATIDISGELSSGWNLIKLQSDGLGHLDASFSADLFRQSL